MIHVTTTEFLQAIEAVRRAASSDETRPHLSCICVDSREEGLAFVATNGHWCARYDVPAAEVERADADRGQLLIPVRDLPVLRSVLKPAAKSSASFVWLDLAAGTIAVGVTVDVAQVVRLQWDRGLRFPPYQQLFDPCAEYAEPDADFGGVGISGIYARHVAESFASAGSDTFGLRFKGPLDPIFCTAPDSRLSAIVMPARVAGLEPRRVLQEEAGAGGAPVVAVVAGEELEAVRAQNRDLEITIKMRDDQIAELTARVDVLASEAKRSDESARRMLRALAEVEQLAAAAQETPAITAASSPAALLAVAA